VYKQTVRNISDLKQRFIDTWTSKSQNGIDEAVGQCKKRLRASVKVKEQQPGVFRAPLCTTGSFQSHQQLYQRTRYIWRHFRRSYLKANKLGKSKGTRKVEYAYHFRKCSDAVCPKLSKSVHACRKYSLRKLARFSETSVDCVQPFCLCTEIFLCYFYPHYLRSLLTVDMRHIIAFVVLF